MKRMTFVVAAVAVVVAAVPSFASTISATVRSHSVVFREGEQSRLVQGVFTDERVIADLHLDVYKVVQLPSSAAHYSDLRKLTAADWLDHVQIRISPRGPSAAKFATPRWHVVRSTVQERGPDAQDPSDKEMAVPFRTYRAVIDFGPMPVGEYILTATAAQGIDSVFPFEIRTGDEPAWRDLYLQTKAAHATTYDEYRALTLRRLDLDPNRLDIVLDLIDRALQYGTIEETKAYLGRAEATAKRLAPTTLDRSASVRALSDIGAALPDYFAHRSEWTMTRDVNTGAYAIRSRATGSIVKALGPQSDR